MTWQFGWTFNFLVFCLRSSGFFCIVNMFWTSVSPEFVLNIGKMSKQLHCLFSMYFTHQYLCLKKLEEFYKILFSCHWSATATWESEHREWLLRLETPKTLHWVNDNGIVFFYPGIRTLLFYEKWINVKVLKWLKLFEEHVTCCREELSSSHLLPKTP